MHERWRRSGYSDGLYWSTIAHACTYPNYNDLRQIARLQAVLPGMKASARWMPVEYFTHSPAQIIHDNCHIIEKSFSLPAQPTHLQQTKMPQILGHNVGSIGYGLQWHTLGHILPSEEQAFDAMRAAVELGCLLWDGGEFYGKPEYNSLVLLNRFFSKFPQYAGKVVLNIKGASEPTMMPNGSPDFVRKSVSNCLAQLGGKAKIAMFECARRDKRVPLETTLSTLKELVEEGKIGSVALSEVNAATIRQAAEVVKISAVEVELSLWCTDPLSNGIAKTCAELDIPILA